MRLLGQTERTKHTLFQKVLAYCVSAINCAKICTCILFRCICFFCFKKKSLASLHSSCFEVFFLLQQEISILFLLKEEISCFALQQLFWFFFFVSRRNILLWFWAVVLMLFFASWRFSRFALQCLFENQLASSSWNVCWF